MTPAARLSNLGIVSNITRIEAVGAWQQTAIKEKLSGDNFWQLGIASGLSTGPSSDVGLNLMHQFLCDDNLFIGWFYDLF